MEACLLRRLLCGHAAQAVADVVWVRVGEELLPITAVVIEFSTLTDGYKTGRWMMPVSAGFLKPCETSFKLARGLEVRGAWTLCLSELLKSVRNYPVSL